MSREHIALFFTYKTSLLDWEETGLLEREVRLYQEFLKRGVHTTFVTYGDRSDFRYSQKLDGMSIFPVHSVVRRWPTRVGQLLQSLLIPFVLKKYLQHVTIIKTNQMWGSWVAIVLKLVTAKPLVIRCGYEWYRNWFIRGDLNISRRWSILKTAAFYLEKFAYRLADAVIISNETDANFIIKTFKIDPSKIHMFRNFIDTVLFSPDGSKRQKRLLYVGRLVKRKNVKAVLQAIRGLNIGFDIVGEGDQKEMLKDYVTKNNLDVKFLGQVSNNRLPGIMNRYRYFILPSLYENSPKTLLEAMSCGLAVIGTDVPGIREILAVDENGVLCCTSTKSIRSAIKKVMKDEELETRIGEKARKFVLRNCELGTLAVWELSVYTKLFKDGRLVTTAGKEKGGGH
jgi:glycosyltransferase involved in cell wall biosynthesis